MQKFDKVKIKNNFSNCAKNYDENAILQKIVARKLADFAKKNISSSKKIIDLGAGTGFLSEEITSKFSDKNITHLDFSEKMLSLNKFDGQKVIADIESLPFKNRIFDLALSSLSFQWLNDLELSLKGIEKIIKKEGNLYFSTLIDGSLKELKITAEKATSNLEINDFITQQDLEKILIKLNFDYEIKTEQIVMPYDDFYSILKSIKSIGAGYRKNKSYISKKEFEKMASFYLKNFNLNNKVLATWEIAFISIYNK